MSERVRGIALSLVIGTLALTIASCGGSQTTTEQTSEPAAMEQPTSGPMSDENIAAVVLAANNADIENSRLAASRATDPEVKGFAERMMQDHTASNQKAQDLAARLNLTPQENQTSTGMKNAQESIRMSLQGRSGADFDRAYVENEVALHQTVLDAIDQTLLPNAQNAELKQLLTETRPVIQGHLEHARQLQAKLGGTAGTGTTTP